MNLQLIDFNNEKIGIFIPIGSNRSSEIIAYSQKVFDLFKIPVNYFKFPFPNISHGQALDFILKECINYVDYFVFFEQDSIPLDESILDIIYSKIKDKKTIFASSQTAMHKDLYHIYGAPNFLCFSKELFIKLGKPSLNDNFENCDTAQNLTRCAENSGATIALIYPSHFYQTTEEEQNKTGNPEFWLLGQRYKFGLGTTYGELIYHSFMNNIQRSEELFINKAQEILNRKFSYEDIEGWFDFEKEYDFIVDNAKDNSIFVEIGSFLGKSSCYLAQKIKQSGKKIKLYCVDTFKGIENDSAYKLYYDKYGSDYFWKFKENVKKCGVEDFIFPIRNTSYEASLLFENNTLDFVYIDANHTYEHVKNDILTWKEKLKSNGIMAGHDYANYCDVPLAVNEIFRDNVIKPETGSTWKVFLKDLND